MGMPIAVQVKFCEKPLLLFVSEIESFSPMNYEGYTCIKMKSGDSWNVQEDYASLFERIFEEKYKPC